MSPKFASRTGRRSIGLVALVLLASQGVAAPLAGWTDGTPSDADERVLACDGAGCGGGTLRCSLSRQAPWPGMGDALPDPAAVPVGQLSFFVAARLTLDRPELFGDAQGFASAPRVYAPTLARVAGRAMLISRSDVAGPPGPVRVTFALWREAEGLGNLLCAGSAGPGVDARIDGLLASLLAG